MISKRVLTLIQIVMKNKFSNRQSVQSESNKIYDTITNAMIELLESLKTNPERWVKPWILSENGSGAHNAISKRSYSGDIFNFLAADKYIEGSGLPFISFSAETTASKKSTILSFFNTTGISLHGELVANPILNLRLFNTDNISLIPFISLSIWFLFLL